MALLLSRAAGEAVGGDEEAVVAELERGREREPGKDRRVVVRGRARGDRAEHVRRDDRVMDVGVDFAREEHLQNWVAVADAHRVDEDVTGHLHLRMESASDECEGLPKEREHGMILRCQLLRQVFFQHGMIFYMRQAAFHQEPSE